MGCHIVVPKQNHGPTRAVAARHQSRPCHCAHMEFLGRQGRAVGGAGDGGGANAHIPVAAQMRIRSLPPLFWSTRKTSSVGQGTVGAHVNKAIFVRSVVVRHPHAIVCGGVDGGVAGRETGGVVGRQAKKTGCPRRRCRWYSPATGCRQRFGVFVSDW